MARFVLLALVLVALFSLTSAQTICQNYSVGGVNSNSSSQVNLITAIVARAALGGIFQSPTTAVTYNIPGLFNSTGPLYNIFTGRTQYRAGAPDYTNTSSADFGRLATKLVAYFGALFGCTASGFPSVSSVGTYNQYAVHANMSITQSMETYFNTQLANTLYSFGVDGAVVGTAATVLGYFNRCGAPIGGIGDTNNSPVQICGDSTTCSIATNANYGTCVQYYGYPAGSSSSSTGSGNGATGKYAVSGLLIAAAAIVASLVL